jgi:hypothetical protein
MYFFFNRLIYYASIINFISTDYAFEGCVSEDENGFAEVNFERFHDLVHLPFVDGKGMKKSKSLQSFDRLTQI